MTTSLVYFAISKLGISWEKALYELPICFLMLMLRQHLYQQGEPGITLTEMETLDSMDFDQLLKQQHEKFAKGDFSLA